MKLAFLLVVFFAGGSLSWGFNSQEYLTQKCLSCHTVGGGDDVGPDLKGIEKRRDRAWIIRFIKESQAMIKEGDPLANELFNKYKQKKMPDHDLTDEEASLLLDFIVNGKIEAVEKAKSALDANSFDIKRGEELFTGITPFKNGGASCISCHSANHSGILGGGLLGPNLTHAYSNYGDNGISKVLKNINFPTMIKVYEGHKLEDEEVFQLKAYLFSTDKVEELHDDNTKKILFIAVIGVLLLLGLFDLIWIRRKKTNKKIL